MQENYTQPHCWQYDIRLKNVSEDLLVLSELNINPSELKISDFTFEFIPKTDKTTYAEVKVFIQRHEWLGKMSNYPTHLFISRYKGILAGVVVMDMPSAFSSLLGSETRKLERLISRGACISWSPKNLASALIMWSIKWMVKNTDYRIFTAYSDPEAKELGTIYQACNFIYLGKNSGTSKMYQTPEGKWVSDRYFRCRSFYKRIAISLNIQWNMDWQNGDSIIWDKMPDDIELIIRTESKRLLSVAPVKVQPKKHKYCYILGSNNSETKYLKKQFELLNPKLVNLQYPKNR
jgi:hypothetical protein